MSSPKLSSGPVTVLPFTLSRTKRWCSSCSRLTDTFPLLTHPVIMMLRATSVTIFFIDILCNLIVNTDYSNDMTG
ncbi:Uncharacterised protein [Salmonella enterica subsp. enterica serovar Typhi]|nr:Uncharacterised protein [Salmonella enterica subsp. enterica serovar Typhi]